MFFLQRAPWRSSAKSLVVPTERMSTRFRYTADFQFTDADKQLVRFVPLLSEVKKQSRKNEVKAQH